MSEKQQESTVVMRIPRSEKAGWVHAAQKEGKTLIAWIRQHLAKAIEENKNNEP